MNPRILKTAAALAALAGLVIPSTCAFAVAPAEDPAGASSDAVASADVADRAVPADQLAKPYQDSGINQEIHAPMSAQYHVGDVLDFADWVDAYGWFQVDGMVATTLTGEHLEGFTPLSWGTVIRLDFLHEVTQADLDRGYVEESFLVGAHVTHSSKWVEDRSETVRVSVNG